MTIYVWGAIAVVILTLAALIRRYDTKLVLLIAGLAMCCLSMNPMAAFQQFDKSMTNSALIISICSSMGFAACVTMTKCDLHLVSLLTKPLNKLGILLLPCCMIVTGIASVAIGSLAGLCAAIGPTLVGLMIRAGFRPAMAAAVIISSTLPNYWSPGSTDNIYVAKLANIPVMDMVTYVAPTTLILSALSIVFVMIVCLLFKDYRKEGFGSTGVHPGEDIQKKLPDLPEKPNLLMAFAPLLPVVLLFVISLCFPGVKMSVATAMLMGLIYVMIVTRLNPQQLCSKFFDGMGKQLANVITIVIAGEFFAKGLTSTGSIDAMIQGAQTTGFGASGLTLVMIAIIAVCAILMGSGNAPFFAFANLVPAIAAKTGVAASFMILPMHLIASSARAISPITGVIIVASGMAGISPFDLVKRTAIPMAVSCILIVAANFVIFG